MKITGIIAEYNPFHNGHSYQIERARALSGCDAVVAVMSGNFVQRGEPAAFDKWARARMALQCGVDAVFELPAFYALQSADWFAWGGVATLNGLGADCLCFGAESPDLTLLRQLSGLWDDEPEELRAAIRSGLKAGKPHPKARAEALGRWLGHPGSEELLASPNSVLGAMYLKQLAALESSMEPLAIQRVQAGYHDENITGAVASATAIRKALAEGSGGWRQAVPAEAAAIIAEQEELGAGPVWPDDFSQALLYALRITAQLPDTAEGLHNRMARAAAATGSFSSFCAAAKSKRYTLARIKRAAMQAMMGITADDIAMLRTEKPIYARLLGYSRRAEGLVGELAGRARIPFVARAAEFEPKSEAMARLWEIDRLASDVYALGIKNPALRLARRDYKEKMIIL